MYSGSIFIFLSSNGVDQDTTGYKINGLVNDGAWHVLTGVFNNGTIEAVLDGVEYSMSAGNYTSVYNGSAPVTIGGRADKGANFNGGIAMASLGDATFYTASNWQDILFSECGNYYATLTGVTFATNWQKDTGSEVYPRNMLRGSKVFTNGTFSENVYFPLATDTATALSLLPAGYSLQREVQPGIFLSENSFTIPVTSSFGAAGTSVSYADLIAEFTGDIAVGGTVDVNAEGYTFFDVLPSGGIVNFRIAERRIWNDEKIWNDTSIWED